jgi:tripartite-type tricarboxylate transporter receptor subunit TctC
MVDVLGGQVPIMFDQVSTAVNYTKTGKLYPIGVTSKTRSAIMPDVPTLDEAGLKGFEDSTFNGLLAPAGTPPEIIKRLHDEVAKILSTPELIKQFKDKGVELQASPNASDFGAYIAKQFERYQALAKAANIKAD